MTKKRNRRTRAEMLEAYKAKVAQLEAEEAGQVDTSTTNGTLKALKARLRKAQTELRGAQMTLNGVMSEDGKGFVRSSIADKIAQTEKRLESQRETQRRAENFLARLPFDIETLEALVASAESGDEVEFPTDLTPLTAEEARTDEEHEIAYANRDQDN